MKIVLTIILLGATLVTCSLPIQLSEEMISAGQDHLAKVISEEFIARFESKIREISVLPTPSVTLLPPINDPVIMPPQQILLNLTIPDPYMTIAGPFNLTVPTKVKGLSKVSDVLRIGYNPLVNPNGYLKIRWDFGIPSLQIEGESAMNLIVDLGSQHKFFGSGNLSIRMDDVYFKLNAVGVAPLKGNMVLKELDVDLGFSDLDIQLGESWVDATPVNWTRQSEYFKIFFHAFWTPEARGIINQRVRCNIDYAVNDCNAVLLITSGNTDCLKGDFENSCCTRCQPPPETTIAVDESTDGTGSAPVTLSVALLTSSLAILSIFRIF